MKQIFTNPLRAFMLAVSFLFVLSLSAVEVEIDGINYELVSKIKEATVVAKSSSKYTRKVVIPESVEYEGVSCAVTSIGTNAFRDCFGLTSVTIPNSVTSIGNNAFNNCTGLTSVHISDITAWCNITFSGGYYSNPLSYAHFLYVNGEEVTDLIIPEGVTAIKESAFAGCFGLTSVTIHNSVTSIGDGAFTDCSCLTSVTIPNSVTSIGYSAFSRCSGLTSVIIPSSVTSIDGAFYGCSGLTSVTIPNSVTSIDGAFYGCSGLTSVTIPNSVTSIDGAFSGCSGLTSVTIPNSVTSIGRAAFEGCSGLTSVTIPNSVTSIGDWTFSGCSGLTSVTIPNSVTSIGNGAFSDCSGLTSVTIPNSVTSIGQHAFYGCSDLTSVTIPNSVTSIDGAFYGCSGLTSVTIPNSVTSIGNYAFDNCSGLKEVHISDIAAWCNIDFDDFYSNPLVYAHHLYLNGKEVTDLIIPEGVTAIKDYAFCDCSGLTSVTIPNSVTSIYWKAFAECHELTDVYCYAEKVPSTESNAFEGSYVEYVTLHVPTAAMEDYKTTTPWSSFGTIVSLSGDMPVEPEIEKCETPSVVYKDGKLSLTSDTEGAEFITKVVADDAKTFYDSEIEFSASYSIEVFALKSGCENSDTVNVTLCWIDQDGADEENGIINVPSVPVLVQSNGGILTLDGVPAGTDITVYTTSGTEIAKTIATGTTTSVSVGLSNGTVVIVKIGNRSVKVRLR